MPVGTVSIDYGTHSGINKFNTTMVRVPGNIKRVKQNQGYVAKLPANPASFLKPGEV